MNLVKRTVLLLALLLFLPACSWVDGLFENDDDDPLAPAELVDIVAEVQIKKLWSSSIGAGQGKAYNRLQPVINGQTLYTADIEGVVTALDKNSGKRLWRIELDRSISGALGFGDGKLLLGGTDGEVYLLDASDGSLEWSAQLKGEVLAAPQSNGKVVVVQSYDGRLQGLSATDGEILWTYDSNLPVLTIRGTSTPVINGSMVIAGFANGRVLAFDIATGAVRWEARIAIAQGRSEIDRIVDVDGSMLLAGSVLYAVSYQGRVAAIDVNSGRKQWQQDASSYAGLSQGFGNIYVADAGGSLIAYYRSGQGVRWEQPALENRKLSAPAVVRSYVVVADFEGYIHVLSQVDGHFVGRVKLGSDGIRADMLVDDNILYALGNSGTMAAFQITPLK